MAKIDVYQKLESAKKLRDDAEAKAKQIEKDCLNDLKTERKDLAAKLALIDEEIGKITGVKPVSTAGGSGKGRVDSEATILGILAKHPGISCHAIETHPDMIALYATIGKAKASPQSIKLKSMVEAGKLVKTGELKKAVYSLAPAKK